MLWRAWHPSVSFRRRDIAVNQAHLLKAFFSADRWKASIDRFPLSGYSLVDQVNSLQPKVVVDVGCGFNPFKGKISNLIGIDIANTSADLVADFLDAPFADESIDVVLALGSINFGCREDVANGLRKVHQWLRPNGYLFMRVNPGEPIGDGIVVFPWSEGIVAEFSNEIGFRIACDVQEEQLVLSNGVSARRLFWVYMKRDAQS